jgi:hypothetical protein
MAAGPLLAPPPPSCEPWRSLPAPRVAPALQHLRTVVLRV